MQYLSDPHIFCQPHEILKSREGLVDGRVGGQIDGIGDVVAIVVIVEHVGIAIAIAVGAGGVDVVCAGFFQPNATFYAVQNAI